MDVVSYALVIASNASFLIPTGYLVHRCELNNAVHVLLCLALMAASTLYHICDQPNDGVLGGVCVIPFPGLYYLDFSLSIMVAVNILTYKLPSQLSWMRSLCIVAMYLTTSFIYASLSSFNHFVYYGTGVLIALFIIVMRAMYGYISIDRRGIATVVLFVCGFACYILDTVVPTHYQILHSAWHVLAAIGTLSGFNYFDKIAEERACSLQTPESNDEGLLSRF
jgi:uncharacterized protein DUF3522